MNPEEKIKPRQELAGICREQRSRGKRIVFTNGCFDILHRGHADYLYQARQKGDLLLVGLNSDDSVQRLKGPGRPFTPGQDRAYLLASLQFVDYVCLFEEDTPLELIRALQPDVLIKGGDYQTDQIVGREIVEARGGVVETIPLVQGRSTTNVIAKIAELARQGLL